jgi:hypothetical protein
MNRLFYIPALILCLAACSHTAVAQDEISLYDSKGKPVAYIATKEDSTIYSWDGYPLAYVYRGEKDIHIFGFNGKHLGWYQQGIIYNQKGHVVGFIEDAVMIFTEPEPYKPIKKSGPFRSYKEVVPFKPYFTNTFSKRSLISFLQEGVN